MVDMEPTKTIQIKRRHSSHEDAVGTLTIDDPRLDGYRPDPAIVQQYVSRKMPNGMTDIEYCMAVWRGDETLGCPARENLMFVGDTQGGKTMLVNVLACKIGEEMGLGVPVPVFTLSASNGITDFDLFGQDKPWTNPETGTDHIVWLPGLADMAARVGGILYIDEANMMPERVTSSLHPLCDYRRMFVNRNKAVKVPGDGFVADVVQANPDLWIVGTMNPNYRGAGPLNEAFSERFRWLLWDYDQAVETKLIPNDAVRTLGTALRQLRELGKIRTPTGTATLMRMVRDVHRDGVDMALYVLRSKFTADERPYVDEVIESRSFKVLIANAAEHRHPLSGSGEHVMDEESPF